MPTMLGSGISASLLLLLLSVAAPAASAQDQTPGLSIPHVLRPDETSSPRQTLTRFLMNARQAIESYEEGSFDEEAFWAHRQLTMALDFSATPHSGSWTVQTERVLQLMEILERVPLPPVEEIPGDREVADGRITKWFIPGTRIKIARIESGPREGEFLFSSETVERLESHYRMIRHLPGKPESFAGFYETYMQSERTAEAREAQLRNRLKGIDMSSPRSTLDGFLDAMNRAYHLVMEADAAMKADPPTMTKQEAIEVDIMAGNLLRRAATALDLRKVPEAHREEVGLESVLQLKEILDRMLLPPLAAIPSEDMVNAVRRGEGVSQLRPGEPYRWKYPTTEFEIIENMEGSDQGSFRFSAETVSRLYADFLAVRDLPYRADSFGTPGPEYLAPDKSKGFYDYYISAPGYMVPGASFLGSLVDRLPEWTQQTYEGQAIWQWAGLLLSLLAVLLVGIALFLYILRLAKRLREPYRHWVRILAPLVQAVFVIEVIEFLNEDPTRI
jgi:MscS family membrane protein